jgi:hypothetical protein
MRIGNHERILIAAPTAHVVERTPIPVGPPAQIKNRGAGAPRNVLCNVAFLEPDAQPEFKLARST